MIWGQGPILGCAFGFAIRDRNLFLAGLLNLLLALVISLLLGFILGALLVPYAGMLKWPTSAMRANGQTLQLLFGAAIAALSGTAVALAESNANISSVVGTAIAAALLPPTVNCGICLAYAIAGQYFTTGEDAIDDSERMVFYEISVGSILLVWVNVIFIYLFAILVFKIKKVGQFQLIRRVDREAWKNLPKVQRTPTNRRAPRGFGGAAMFQAAAGGSPHIVGDDESPCNMRPRRRTSQRQDLEPPNVSDPASV